MRSTFLLNYTVKGIKSLDEKCELSFGNKVLSKTFDAQKYNVKGIYGTNGSGKSGIVTSVKILKNILLDTGYLSNPVNQAKLRELVNKKTGKLEIEVVYVSKTKLDAFMFQYNIAIGMNDSGKYVILSEKMMSKNAYSSSSNLNLMYEIENGKILGLDKDTDEKDAEFFRLKTMNLLSNASLSSLYFENVFLSSKEKKMDSSNQLMLTLILQFIFATTIYVYLDESDTHTDYLTKNFLNNWNEENYSLEESISNNTDLFQMMRITDNIVLKNKYEKFKKQVNGLYRFLHIFKPDLTGIKIDKREDKKEYICDLVMEYESYHISAEFESTGIKKLIQLYAYLKEMDDGAIVFIDEFDSNLHDVYLCAVLEYLMEYGEGQLCFTTHNVGPMDVLKNNKKSIDFLSINHKIYPWKKSGNYSPSKLYRNGMIEGSPFNIDAIDFIGVFKTEEEES